MFQTQGHHYGHQLLIYVITIGTLKVTDVCRYVCLYCILGQTAVLLNVSFAFIVALSSYAWSMFQLPVLLVISKPGSCKLPAYKIAASDMLRAEQL